MTGQDPTPSPPQAPASPSPGRRRRWERWVLLGSVILGIAFYQPIGVFVLETVAIHIAKQANLDLSLKISGNLISSLTIESLHGTADGETPVRKLSVERADFRYSFWNLATKGVTDFLSSYHLKNATVEIDELPDDASDDAVAYAKRLTDLLRDILQQPALFSNRVELENVNVRLNLESGVFIIDSIHILLDPLEPGFIQIGRVDTPHLPSWHQIHAEATYNGRRLILDELEMGEEMKVIHAELIPARLSNGENILLARLAVFGGEIDLDLRSEEDTAALKLAVSNVSLDRISDYFHLAPTLGGTLEHFTATLGGEPANPSTWEGQFSIRLDKGQIDTFHLGLLELQAKLREGHFHLHDSHLTSGGNVLKLHGDQPFPGSFNALFTQGLKLQYELSAQNLKEIYADLPEGRLESHGDLVAGKAKLAITTQSKLTGLRLEREGRPLFALGAGEMESSATFLPEAREHDSPWYTGLKVQANFRTTGEEEKTGMILQSVALDRIAIAFRQDEGEFTLEKLELQRKENRASARATVKLPASVEPVKAWEELEFDTAFELHAPDLHAFNTPDAAQELKGMLEGKGAFQRKGGNTRGEGHLEATGLGWREFHARRLSLHLPLEGDEVPRARLELEINDRDRVEGTARIRLQAPYDYNATLSAHVSDLALFQPFLDKPLGGSLSLDWKGQGRFDSAAPEHSGGGTLVLKEGLFDTHHPLAAEITARYSPEAIDIPTFSASAPQGNIAAKARWAENRLGITDLTLHLGEHGSATGQLSLPLNMENPTNPTLVFPKEGVLEGSLTMKQLDLAKVLHQPPPEEEKKGWSRRKRTVSPSGVQGVVDASLALGGTVQMPELTLDVKARQLRSRAAERLEAASLDALLSLKEGRLDLKGEARVPSIQPLRFEGHLPLDIQQVAQEGRLDPATPVALKVVLPRSSAGVLANLTSSLRYIEGTIAMDASVQGPLEHPVFSGGIHFNLPALRFRQADIPGINRFRGDLLFKGNELTIERFEGDVAGGPFQVSGKVGLKDWSDPQLDLRLQSNGTLLVRNDTLMIRTDSKLRVNGPLKGATVKGRVTLRKSRFYRDVELLPVALPGKPVAEPVDAATEISLDIAPIRDWKFDFAIRTKEPFLIRSNLARGGATIDLKVGGTGLAPTLDGTVRLDQLAVILPFSRLEIEHGFIRFNPNDPFNPALDIHGSSRLRNTTVHTHIYGTASQPETIFTSEPPLPQEEIIALLATGATTQGLADSNEVMAGRAGSLLLQELYHKVTRQRPKKFNKATAGDDPLGDRFSLDVGTVDPRTGRQEVGGRFRLNKEFELGAGLDIEGDVRVQLRYLLRFR